MAKKADPVWVCPSSGKKFNLLEEGVQDKIKKHHEEIAVKAAQAAKKAAATRQLTALNRQFIKHLTTSLSIQDTVEFIAKLVNENAQLLGMKTEFTPTLEVIAHHPGAQVGRAVSVHRKDIRQQLNSLLKANMGFKQSRAVTALTSVGCGSYPVSLADIPVLEIVNSDELSASAKKVLSATSKSVKGNVTIPLGSGYTRYSVSALSIMMTSVNKVKNKDKPALRDRMQKVPEYVEQLKILHALEAQLSKLRAEVTAEKKKLEDIRDAHLENVPAMITWHVGDIFEKIL